MTARQLQSLPAEISLPLRQLDRKVRLLAMLRGVAVLVTLLIVGIGGGLLVDLWLGLGETVRVVWLSTLAAAAFAVVVWGIVRPLFWRTGPADLAALVESAHPELNERLTSTVELLRPDLPEAHKGSSLMRELLVTETTQVLRGAELDDSVDGARAQRAGWLAVAAMFAMIVPLFISRDGYTLLLTRFFTPWRNLEQASNLYFVVDQGDRTVPRGSDVAILAEPRWRLSEQNPPDEVWLAWKDAAGEADQRRMLWDPDRKLYTATLPHVFQPFEFHVTSGPAKTREYHVNVVEAPSIGAFVVDVQPPAYTGLPAQRLDGAVGETSVFERSQVKFELQFNKPITSAEVVWFGAPSGAAPAATTDGESIRTVTPLTLAADRKSGTIAFEALPEAGGRFAVKLADEHGLLNPSEPARALRVQLDQPPTVAFADQVDQPEARPNDVITLPVTASDDIAVHDLELHYSVVPQGGRNMVAAEGRLLGVKAIDHSYSLDLATLSTDLGVPLHLKNNDRLRLKLRAADERPVPGPNEAWSEERTITIRDDAAPYGFEMLAQSREQWRKMLQEIRQQLQQNREQVGDLKDETDADIRQKIEFDQNEAIAPLATQQRELAKRLEQLAAMLGSSPLFGNLTETAQGVAREELAAAPQALDTAAGEAELPKKGEQFEASAKQLDSAIAKLTELEAGFGKIAELERDLSEIQRLAERASRLAEDAVALDQDRSNPPPDMPAERQQSRNAALEQDRQDLMQEHQELSQDLQNLLERRPEILDAAREQQFDRLRDLAEQALELAKPQDQLAAELNTDAQQQANDLQDVMQKQRELLAEAQQLAGATEPNQAQKLVKPLDLDALRETLNDLQSGNAEAAAQQQERAAEELERLAAELRKNEQLPADPYEAAQALVQREEALKAEIDQAKQEFEKAREAAKQQPADAAAQEQLADARQELRNLAAAQTAIQAAAAHLQVPVSDQDKIRDSVKNAFDTVNQLLDDQPAKALDEAEQTRRSLQALADDVGPADKREKEAINEARRLRDQQEGIAREAAEIAKRANEGQGQDQTNEQLSQLANREQQLARDLAQFDSPPPAQQDATEALQEVANASARLEQRRPQESAAAAREAAQALTDLEQSLAGKAAADEKLAELIPQEQKLGAQLANADQKPSADELRAAAKSQRDAARQVSELRTPLLEQQRDAARQQLEESARAAEEAANGEAEKLANAQRETQEAQQALEELNRAVAGESMNQRSPDQRQQMQNELQRAFAQNASALNEVADKAQQLAQRQAELRNRTEELARDQAAAAAENEAAKNAPPDPNLSKEQRDQQRREREQRAREREQQQQQRANEFRQQQEQLTRDIRALPQEAAGLAAAEAATESDNAREALGRREASPAAAAQAESQQALEDLAAAAQGRQQSLQQAAAEQAQAAMSHSAQPQPANGEPAEPNPGEPAARNQSEQLAERAEALAAEQRQLAAAARESREQRLAQATPSTPMAQPAAQAAPMSPAGQPNPMPAEGAQANAAPMGEAAQQPAAMTPAEQAAAALAAQEQLAQSAAELALATAQEAGAEAPATASALQFAQQTAEAAESAANGQLAPAMQSGQQAAQSAQQASEQLSAAGEGTPEADLAVRAAELAQQQQAVAGQIGELTSSPAARAAAQSQAQQRMSTQAASLAEQFQQVAEELGAQPLDRPQQGQQAGGAQQSSQQASQAIEQSAGNLSQGNPQNAASQASQGAQQLRDAARQALAAAGQMPAQPSSVPQEVGSQLSQAMQQLDAAGQQLAQGQPQSQTGQSQQANAGPRPMGQPGQMQPGQGQPMAGAEQAQAGQPMPGEGQPGEEVASGMGEPMPGQGQPSPQQGQPTNPSTQNLQNVAQSLNNAAEQLGLTPGQMQSQRSQAQQQSNPNGNPSPDGESSDFGAKEELRLTELDVHLKNISDRNWGELPGKLQTEILQSSQTRTGGDYGRVIQRYFEEVSRSRTTPAAAP
jgi:hypothetical protein